MTRLKRGSREYENINDNKVEIEKDEDYQKKLKKYNFKYLLDNLFKDIDYHLVDEVLNIERVIKIQGQGQDRPNIYFSFYKIVNSGQNIDKKRMQIPKDYFGLYSNNRETDSVYFFIGIYPTGENSEPIYVILDNDGYSLQPTMSRSSLWISFQSLKMANSNGIHYSINNRNGNKYVCFKKRYWPLVYNAIISNSYGSIINSSRRITYEEQGNEIKDIDEIEDYQELRDACVVNSKARLRKNPNFRDLTLFEAGYRCNLCGKKETFYTNADIMYFEAHHLIPCNIRTQVNFKKKLDAPANMFCLCPECHRKIHYIKDEQVGKLVEKLYDLRKDSYMKNYEINAQDMIKIYQKIDRKNEDDM